jgi:hypothetical protein
MVIATVAQGSDSEHCQEQREVFSDETQRTAPFSDESGAAPEKRFPSGLNSA